VHCTILEASGTSYIISRNVEAFPKKCFSQSTKFPAVFTTSQVNKPLGLLLTMYTNSTCRTFVCTE
jgi:hypothetical protein